MGCGPSSPEAERTREIDKDIKKGQKEDNRIIKLLLLGAGESGKSTIFKQMKKMYGAQPTDEEMVRVTSYVRENVINFMKALCDAVQDFGIDHLQSEADVQAVNELMDVAGPEELTPALAEKLLALWHSDVVQQAWRRRAEFQIIESHTVFIERVMEIADPSYHANFEDMLLVRIKTSGIRNEALEIDSQVFHIYDVGGQKNERRKWIHCFEGVTAIIFVVGLSEYDQVLLEDPTKNRMMDAIELFQEISGSPYFTEKPDRPATKILVFMNKEDLFKQKLETGPKINQIPEWKEDFDSFADIETRRLQAAGQDASEAVIGTNYFISKFRAVAPKGGEGIVFRSTIAIDPGNVRSVWNVCKIAIIEYALYELGS
uniref:Uncharacterized protein n=1 Tax=Rhizochromulina marina TaxID=1034831 RepID=A0A7S2RAG9_9STRA|mmetsp:Transcript_13489/g.39275  ORF Transcript_13489/g.39275 Transcript_13489/m.39275 type:complete len:373 (+) Transcript_13489:60-1178(+)